MYMPPMGHGRHKPNEAQTKGALICPILAKSVDHKSATKQNAVKTKQKRISFTITFGILPKRHQSASDDLHDPHNQFQKGSSMSHHDP